MEYHDDKKSSSNLKLNIEGLKNNAISFDQLQKLIGPENTQRCEWLTYDQLARYKSIQELLHKGAAVILLQIEGERKVAVGHFIVLLDHGDHYEHFDSYGLSMDEETKITGERHLTNLFTHVHKKIVDNSKKLQTFREDVNTCGRWVAARLLLRHMELDTFLKLIGYFKVNHDDLVSIMTLLLQFKH